MHATAAREDGIDAKLLSTILADFVVPCAPGRTWLQAIDVHADSWATAADLAPLLARNQLYRHVVFGLPMLQRKVANWRSELGAEPGTDADITRKVLGLIGKDAARNLVAAIRLARLKGLLPRGKKPSTPLAPRELTQFALAASERCEENGFAGPGLGFAAGWLYDALAAQLVAKKKPKEASTYLPVVFREALTGASLAYSIGRRLPRIGSAHLVFPAALVAPIGKVMMAALFPREMGARSWSAFLVECDAYKIRRREALWLLEKQRFPITSVELSALAAAASGVLLTAELAIRFQQEPFLVPSAIESARDLANLLSVSLALADAAVRGNLQGEEPPLDPVHLAWLERNGIPIAEAIAEAQRWAVAAK